METQTVNAEISQIQPTQDLAQKRGETRLHDSNGNFAKGNPGGPGRPRTAVLSQALREILEHEGAAKYAKALTKLATGAKRQSDRIAAFNAIADRTEGKPVQAMLVGHTMDESSVRLIAEILGKLHNPPQVEGESE